MNDIFNRIIDDSIKDGKFNLYYDADLSEEFMRTQAEYMDKMKIKPLEYYMMVAPNGDKYLIPLPNKQPQEAARKLLETPILKVVEAFHD